MNKLVLILVSLSLGSCMVMQTPVTVNTAKLECTAFDDFKNAQPLKVRELTAVELQSRETTELALINNIVELKREAQIKHQEFEEAYKRYLLECK